MDDEGAQNRIKAGDISDPAHKKTGEQPKNGKEAKNSFDPNATSLSIAASRVTNSYCEL